jgi:hypothetical protein
MRQQYVRKSVLLFMRMIGAVLFNDDIKDLLFRLGMKRGERF